MAKATGIDAHAHPVGESYKSADDGRVVSDDNNSMEMRAEGSSREGVDDEVLAAGIEALERKRAHWYSYLLTRDFWIVLAMG